MTRYKVLQQGQFRNTPYVYVYMLSCNVQQCPYESTFGGGMRALESGTRLGAVPATLGVPGSLDGFESSFSCPRQLAGHCWIFELGLRFCRSRSPEFGLAGSVPCDSCLVFVLGMRLTQNRRFITLFGEVAAASCEYWRLLLLRYGLCHRPKRRLV